MSINHLPVRHLEPVSGHQVQAFVSGKSLANPADEKSGPAVG
jgi:hypothetical protein